MPDTSLLKRFRQLREDIAEEGTRIRRYSMDPIVRKPDDPAAPDPGREIRDELDQTWQSWIALKQLWRLHFATPNAEGLAELEDSYDRLSRRIDTIQRELISDQSYQAGRGTVLWLGLTLTVLLLVYLATHGVYDGGFEPWAEWGPLKYGEVAFWSAFGALCALLYKATHYLSRRDFDSWYKPWYVSTFLRAPFLAVILMMVVLEFAETADPGSLVHDYLMEEGSKFYFIVFASFCLGLSTDTTNGLIRDLADGVTEFFSRSVNRFSSWLGSLVRKDA